MKPQIVLILLVFLGLFGSAITLFIPNDPAKPVTEPIGFIDLNDDAPLDGLHSDVVYPVDVYSVFKAEGFTEAQAVFFAKQAMIETGDPNNQNTPLRPINGRNNVFGLRVGKRWFNYDSKLDATLDYLYRIQESKYYAPDFDPAELVTKRPHCPEIPDYAARVHAVKFYPPAR